MDFEEYSKLAYSTNIFRGRFSEIAPKDFQILIVGNGKSGNSTLLKSFGRFYGWSKVFHTHSNVYLRNNLIKDKTMNFTWQDIARFNGLFGISKPQVIVSFRDAITRSLSNFFHNFSLPNCSYSSVLRLPRTEIINYYNREFVNHYVHRMKMASFWQTQLKELGINIFNYPKTASERISFESFDFLVMRFDEIDRWELILRSIYGNDFNLMSANLTAHKRINDIYLDIKSKPFVTPDNFRLLWGLEQGIINNYYSETERIWLLDRLQSFIDYD